MWASLSQVKRPGNSPIEPADVVAVALPPGPVWLETVRRVWEADAALLPLDVRLPPAATRALLERARPTVLLDGSGWTRLGGGLRAPELGAIVPTSGTGGDPKLVDLDRAAIEAAVDSSAEALSATADDRWLCSLPPAHVGGLLVLLRAALLGAPVAVHDRFDPDRFGSEPDVAFASIVPTMLFRLLEAEVELTRFRALLVGGATLPARLRERAEEVGAHVVETYGLTESCGGVLYDSRPLRGTEVRVQDGEIVLRGPTIMRGYHLDPDGTQRVRTPEGWLRTGDAGELDGQGRLHVAGRLDELILTGGEKVWPQEVEAALAAHSKIREVAVVGRPHEEWGEQVVAFVVPIDPSDPPDLEDLRELAAARLPRYAAPGDLRLVAQIPRTPSGKVRRSALRGQE